MGENRSLELIDTETDALRLQDLGHIPSGFPRLLLIKNAVVKIINNAAKIIADKR